MSYNLSLLLAQTSLTGTNLADAVCKEYVKSCLEYRFATNLGKIGMCSSVRTVGRYITGPLF